MALARSLAFTKAPSAPADGQKGDATTPKTATVGAVLIGYGLIFVAWAAAYGLWKWRHPTPFHPGADFTIFAPLYIFAQAIERFVEPFTSYLGDAMKPDGSG